MLSFFLPKILPFAKLGFKAIKYFVDSAFRDKVTPQPGSVVYCDLWLTVEHSGIYVGNGQISNIVVDGLAESTVSFSDASSFTSKSMLGRRIYVSCNSNGAVGNKSVGRCAAKHVGTRSFYGLVIKNCHQFSSKCVNQASNAAAEISLWEHVLDALPGETWEPSITALKKNAKSKLGATKWRLWDWRNEGEAEDEDATEPDWQANQDYLKNLPLNPENIAHIQAEMAAAAEYTAEIADENIPPDIRNHLLQFQQTLGDISKKYEEVKDFLAACPSSQFSYTDLQNCPDDFAALTAQLQNNARIKELARKMGRNYISEEKKKQIRIPQANRSEVHGTHRSDDVMRMLPSELLNLEDETLEILFYAKLLEKTLLTYELGGTGLVNGEITETSKKRTGPIVACLDTSGSMQGAPLLKAKALILAFNNILQQENRSLHILIFGASGEISEFTTDLQKKATGLLAFLNNGFGGGTDFEFPLQRAFQIISAETNYLKADILMLSDGDCHLSAPFVVTVKNQKTALDCMIYSVLCNGARVEDNFSDEVVVL